MSKELEYLYDIWGETYTEWGCGPLTDPFTVEVFDEEDERFLTIVKALKRNEPMKPEPIEVQFVEWGTNKNMGKDIRHLCPKCTHTVDNHYCSECGQKIDWESE